jgi:TolB-like protein/Flp pilus assembly protein TadD
MPEPTQKAVFLSYAREDGDAARHIADALRAFGVEVWFDMSELRGGDVWDQKIRRQIKDCALFMPLISSQSDQRGEGYFRLEWKLAVERTHLLAEGMPFLFPVVVDDTSETSASVPEQFLKAQWTRLPGGEPTPQFVEHVKRLLQGPRKAAPSSKAATRAPQMAATAVKSGFPVWVAVVLGVVIIALGAFVIFRPSSKSEGNPPVQVAAVPPPAPKPEEPAAAPINDKSLAVLPFTNMSEEKDSAFFTDGIQEDILTNLALISELRVVSRTSVMQYRDTTKPIRQIAKELGVAYILEGSVRRAGNKVRVTGQLIRAATDEHVWAKAYDRELNDIFAIQESLASDIAAALKAAITPQQKTFIASRATTSVDAYNNYLRAREIAVWSGVDRVTMPQLDRLLQSAVQLDPNFVPAWVTIARVELRAYQSVSLGNDRSHLDAGLAAVANAVRLAPGDPAVINVQGRAAQASGDLVGARTFYERALQLAPGDVEMLISLGNLAAADRRWADVMGTFKRAEALDPRNPVVLWSEYSALLSLRQFDQAATKARLLVELQPDSLDAALALAILPFYSRGSRAEMEAVYSRLTPEQQADPKVIASKLNWYYHGIGDARAYVELRDQTGTDNNFAEDDSTLQYAEALVVLGQRDRATALARPLIDKLKAQCKAEPENFNLLSSLSYAYALSGDHDATMETAARSLAQVKPTDTLGKQFSVRLNVAIVYGWVGEKDKAIDLMNGYKGVPVGRFFNTMSMRNDIDFFPMHGFPRWEALLADPAVNAPLNY